MATKIRSSLFIGLGGTGMTTLLNTKKMFIDTYGSVPPMIGFLGIDTDRGSFDKSLTAKNGQKVVLEPSERMPILVESAMPIYNQNHERFDWIGDSNVRALTNMTIGAGQVRTNGRFAVTNNRRSLVDRIMQAYNRVTSARNAVNADYELLSDKVDIHLVFSLAGGTGAGSFINVAYMLRELFPQSNIVGYALGAEVFRAMRQGPATARVRPNAYGSIVDLDYLMTLTPNDKPFKIKYLDAHDDQTVNDRPFTSFYFIDNKNGNGDTFDNINTLAEMIGLALVISTGELSVASASISDNVAKMIGEGNMNVRNKLGWAAGLGVSEICFDGQALADIYALKSKSRLISRLTAPADNDPQSIADQWINAMQIRENLGRDDVIDYMMARTPKFVWGGAADLVNPKPEVDQYINNAALDPSEQVKERQLDLQKRVAKGLEKLISDTLAQEGGVYTAGQALKAVEGQVKLCDGEMKEELKAEAVRYAQLKSALETAVDGLKKCMGSFFKRGKQQCIDDLDEAVNNLAVSMRETARRQQARTFYTWLKDQLDAQLRGIQTLDSMLDSIKTKTDEAVQHKQQSIGSKSFFQVDLATVTATAVTFNDAEVLMPDLAAALGPGGLYGMRNEPSATVEHALDGFVKDLPTTKSLASRTVDDELKAMDESMAEQVLREAMRKSMPLFTTNFEGYAHSTLDESCFVGVADRIKSPLTAKASLRSQIDAVSNAELVPLGMADRIIILRQVGVVPAFTLGSLAAYRPEYERFEGDHPMTSHIDTGLYKRMRTEKYNLAPAQRSDDTLQWWVKGLLFGIIRRNDDGAIEVKSPTLGSAVHRYWHTLSANGKRLEAYQTMRDNINDLRHDIELAVENIDTPQNDDMIRNKIARAKDNWIEEFSLNTIPLDKIDRYEDQKSQLEAELKYIESL